MSRAQAVGDAAELRLVQATPKTLFIGGEWREAAGGKGFDVEDPATAQTLVSVADASPDDALAALGAATEAFSTFRAMPGRERGEILRRAYELVLERADDLALLMTLEMGKPLPEAKGEVSYAAAYLRWYSEEAVRLHGRFGTGENGGARVLTMQQPVGPCLFITPWNFPLAMGTRKIAPALAAGCTVVVKPAAQTPLSMLALAQIFEQAGLPGGVLNVVCALDSAATMGPLIGDPRLRKLSFTGSTTVGKRLIAQSADQVLRVSMELGGNAPFLVFEDADLDKAVEGALVAKMRNMGEACTAANRFLVHDSLADRFSARLAAAMGELRVARGTEPGSRVGPLIDGAALVKVEELVADACDRGARVVSGGQRAGERGYFYAPTVLADVAPDARLLAEEIFGPVAPITTFTDDDEAIAAANATEYGLVSYVFTENIARAFKVIEAIETGMVGFNQGVVSDATAPFGGVKHSGFGREGGSEGMHEYLATKYVALNVD